MNVLFWKTSLILLFGRKRRLFLTIFGITLPLILFLCVSEGINGFTERSLQHLQHFPKTGVLAEAEGDMNLSGFLTAMHRKQYSFSYVLQKDADQNLHKDLIYRGSPVRVNLEIKILSGDLLNGYLPYQAPDMLCADKIRYLQGKPFESYSDSLLIPCILEQSTSLLLFGDDHTVGDYFSLSGETGKKNLQVCAVIEDLPSSAERNLQLNHAVRTNPSAGDPVFTSCTLYLPASAQNLFPASHCICCFTFPERTFSESLSILQKTDFHSGFSTLSDAGSLLQETLETSEALNSICVPVLLCMLLISGLLIMNTMFFSLQERTMEIGLRRAVGAGVLEILFQFLLEGLCIAMTAFLAASLIAGLLLSVVSAYNLWIAGINLRFRLHPGTLLYTFLIVNLQTEVFSILPAIRAANMEPAAALTDQNG